MLDPNVAIPECVDCGHLCIIASGCLTFLIRDGRHHSGMDRNVVQHTSIAEDMFPVNRITGMQEHASRASAAAAHNLLPFHCDLQD